MDFIIFTFYDFPDSNSETESNDHSKSTNEIQKTYSKKVVKKTDFSYCPVDKSGRFTERKELSPELALICGKSHLYKQEVVQAVLSYIKKHKLQNVKSEIVCDENLEALTKKKIVTYLEVIACLDENMS